MYAVIMAGGSGTRFWPLSREKRPKQLLSLSSSHTLIQETVDRIHPLIPNQNIFIVTVEKLKKSISAQLPHIPPENILAEPYARNTAPAIALAALHVRQRAKKGVMVVLPADHLVRDVKRFTTVLREAEKVVRSTGRVVTLGLKPHYPETGFGYIQAGGRITCGKGSPRITAHTIKRFTEKPGLATAKRFVAQSDYYWNGGIFIWDAATILDEICSHIPALRQGLDLMESAIGKRGEKRLLQTVYKSFPKISIDNGVMEKTSKGAVIPCDIGWNDVGSWSALDDVMKGDRDGNRAVGNFLGVDIKNCTVHNSSKGLVALIGVKDLVVVSTSDAVLVCPKKKSQQVKELVEQLEKKGFRQYR